MTTLTTDRKAEDVMTSEPVCVRPSTTLRELAGTLREHEISGVPVVDQQDRLIGIVSKTDLIMRCAEGTTSIPPALLFEMLAEELEDDMGTSSDELVCVEDFMSTDPVTVTRTTSVGDIARTMFDDRIHRVVVVDADECPVGIISSLDVLGVFAP